MKRLLIIILVTVFGFLATASKTKYYSASTEHFDIIYTEESKKSADSIYRNCEQIYDEVSDLLGYKDDIVIPVWLYSGSQVLNGYETQFPYNRIVLYDTAADIGSLSNMEEQMVGVFRHELTHALQFEIKPNAFLKIGSKIFGDWFSLQGLYLYPSFVEGTAVMSESLGGYGRLNDNSYHQILIQAKLDNRFPSFFKAIGMRDVYPQGLEYSFGGSFMEFIREKYGEGKLRSFFDETGRFHLLPETGLQYLLNFGEREKYDWKEFKDSIVLPYELQEPETIARKARYSELTTNGSDIYVINENKSAVYTLKDGEKLKRKDTVKTDAFGLSVGLDGSYLVLNQRTNGTSMILYSKNEKKLHEFEGYRDGGIVRSHQRDYYVLYRTESQESWVDIYNDYYSKISSIYLGWGITAADFCNPLDEVVAFLTSYKGTRAVVLYNVATGKTAKISNPDNLFITNINAVYSRETEFMDGNIPVEKGVISLSWTTQETSNALVRYAELEISRTGQTLSLQQRVSNVDISGGIYEPFKNNEEVIYIAHFYKYDKLAAVRVDNLNLSEPKEVDFETFKAKTYFDLNGQFEIEQRVYKPGEYFFKGSFIPLALQSTYDGFPLGVTYYTMDPTERFSYTGSLGLIPEGTQFFQSNSFGYSYKNKTVITSFEIRWPQIQTFGSILTQYDFEFSNSYKTLSVWNKISENTNKIIQSPEFKYASNNLTDSLGLSFQSLRKTGKGLYSYSGLTADAQASFVWDFLTMKDSTSKSDLELSEEEKTSGTDTLDSESTFYIYTEASVSYHIPMGLPHSSITVSAAMVNKDLLSVTGSVELMPLCIEIQNGFPFLGLYFNRFVLDVAYQPELIFPDKQLIHNFTGVAYFTVSEAIGMLAKVPVRLGVRANYTLGGEPTFSFYTNLRLN